MEIARKIERKVRNSKGFKVMGADGKERMVYEIVIIEYLHPSVCWDDMTGKGYAYYKDGVRVSFDINIPKDDDWRKCLGII